MPRSHPLSALLVLCAVLALPGCGGTPAGPAVSERYADLELHLEPARDEAPGSDAPRAWTTDDGRTVHLRHVDTIPGTDIRSIRTVVGGDRPAVAFELAAPGAARLQALTADHVGRTLGLVANDRLLIAANIAGPFSGSFQVSTETHEDAERLRRSLLVSDDR
ncbi:hypothetical protein [Luteimonas sp. FCS-9]|uniref:SecDF P1 head subdomain-containing protein n=1 Tax=Luteimonas sp. FCS-9 TaxID=1547516 RepID=UPI00063EB4B6|nr:hypothetical protein [Luteimonas sp. FCS-9]KLI99885.1 hypothetical protein WQ56_10835 [Luteimonas sp. FCS-9]